MPLLILGAMVVVVLVVPGWPGLIIPWVGLAGLLAFSLGRQRRHRQIEAGVQRVQELAQLECHESVLDRAWRMLPRLVRHPALYLRSVALLADSLLRVRAFEAATTCYQRLLKQLPEQHPAAIQLRIHHAFAALGMDHLADADDALRKVRGQLDSYAGTSLEATYHLARLFQHVRTHHFADALETAPDMIAHLRPLGVEAGYGHGLLALCFRESDEAEEARTWWHRATTLLPESALVQRFPELEPVRSLS